MNYNKCIILTNTVRLYSLAYQTDVLPLGSYGNANISTPATMNNVPDI